MTTARAAAADPRAHEFLTGPFDVIGDVHGCRAELEGLLGALGYARRASRASAGVYAHPDGRMAVFVGDLVDRGPDVPGVLRLVFDMLREGSALCVLGNHEHKLLRKLEGRDVKLGHGLHETLMQLARAPEALVDETLEVLRTLTPHIVLDRGRLVVAHAGIRPALVGRTSAAARAFALYGDTTGEVDALGLPVRRDWAARYRGLAHVVYGHTPVDEAVWVGRTIDVDTGCVFGGALSAVRWPERDVVRVPAARAYWAHAPHARPPAS